jgi:hypothetical protein
MSDSKPEGTRIERIVRLSAPLGPESQMTLLKAIADLLESYPAESLPWDFSKFSDAAVVPKAGPIDKPTNTISDDAKRLREYADTIPGPCNTEPEHKGPAS